MSSYADLDVYKLAHELGVSIHKLTLQLPKHETYEIGSQLRRASKSISANIVEGYGRRRYKADFVKFLIYAHSSCDETLEWLKYIQDCHPDLSSSTDPFVEQTMTLGRKLNHFIQAVEKQHLTSKS
ncbi:MAG: four helix bundle protein [Kiritimatiellales bacterium]|nr:four helix bundle protein [Kiritimatiellales bacterium]MCF7864237.1 four helix bundle protein [Kiritimatiellales bacterium]